MEQDYTSPQIFRFGDVNATDLYLSYADAFPQPVMSLARFRELYFEAMPLNKRFSFGCRIDDEIVAFALCRELPDKEIYILLCGVRQKYQNQGLLTALIDQIAHEARQAGFSQISLDVNEENTSAIQAFGSLGFVPGELLSSFYRFPRFYKGELSLSAITRAGFEDAVLDKLSESLAEHLTYYKVLSRGSIEVGHVVLHESRHQIVFFKLNKKYHNASPAFFDLLATRVNCTYIFKSSEDQLLSGYGFKKIISQITMIKSLNE